MALLSMCVRAGMDVGAAHVNYRKRPQADMEEKAVKAWCRRHRVPCYVLDRPYEYEGNFQAFARAYRYRFFTKTAKAHAFDGVLVAHQQDDLIETYLMQKHQNITPAWYGLKRTVFMDDLRVVRPLLNKTKASLEAYCRQEGVPYYIDSSNLSDAYARNRVRHHEVQDMDASARQKLLQEIAAANRQLQSRRRQASGLIRGGKLPLASYRKADKEIRLCALRLFLERDDALIEGASRRYLEEMDGILMHHADFLEAVRDRWLIQQDGSARILEQMPAAYQIQLKDSRPRREECFRVARRGKTTQAVTLAESDFPLTVRSWQAGDSIRLRFGRKSVHRFFIDRRIPLWKRASWPVVLNASGAVILVPGLGCDVDHYSIKPTLYVIE